MKFCWTTIHVRDMEASLGFYRDIVGLKLDRRHTGGTGSDIVFLGEGETKVELIYNAKHKDVVIGQDISLGFEVPSLEEKMDFLKDKGIPIHSGPFQPAPYIRFFYVLDPNGVKIQFLQNL